MRRIGGDKQLGRRAGMDRETPERLTHLWTVTGDGLAAMYRDSPRFEATIAPEDWSVVGGEPEAIFNWLAVHTASADNAVRLRAGVAALRARRLPALILVAEGLAAGLEPVARELGLETPHQIPL